MRTDHSYLLDESALAQVLHGPKRLQHVYTYSIDFAKGEVHQAVNSWDFDPKDVQEVLEAASYARNPHSGGRAYIRLPYMELLRAVPHLQILGVMVDD